MARGFPIAAVAVIALAAAGLFFLYGDRLPVASDDEFTGGASVVFTLTYEDGSERVFEPNTMSSLVGPMTVTDTSGVKISSISYEIKARAVYDKPPDSFSFAGSTYAVKLIAGTISKTLDSGDIGNPASLPSGTNVVIKQGSISHDSINYVCGGTFSRDTEIYVKVTADVQLTCIWGDQVQTKSAGASGQVKLLYEPDGGTLSSLSVTVSQSVLR